MLLLNKAFVAAAALLPAVSAVAVSRPVSETTCGGKKYTYERLAGYGFVASDAVDKFGDNLGGLGSAIFVEKGSWKKKGDGSYKGTLWALPGKFSISTVKYINADPVIQTEAGTHKER